MKKELISCEYYVEGMHCAACELLIEKKLSKLEGVQFVDAKLSEGKVSIHSNHNLNIDELNKLIEADGYKIVENKNTIVEFKRKNYLIGFLISIVFFIVFAFIQKSGLINTTDTDQITLPFVFLIGVIASLSTCMAVVGGLVLSLSSSYAKENQFKPMLMFHLSRVIGFFILGGLIGLLGSAFVLTPVSSFLLNLVLFIVMIIMAINLLDLLPNTKKLQLRMPKFVGKKIINISETNNNLTPLFLGAATFFLPCGFTQSMQLYSLTTGSFLNGAITMLIYALGTLPILALISFASTKFSKGLQSDLFFKTAGFIVLLFAIFNFSAALSAIGIIPPLFNF